MLTNSNDLSLVFYVDSLSECMQVGYVCVCALINFFMVLCYWCSSVACDVSSTHDFEINLNNECLLVER